MSNDKDKKQAESSQDQQTGKEVRKESADKKPGLMDKIRNFKEYLILSRKELLKVSWPTLKETRTTSLVVLAFVVVMAILLGVVDLILSGVVRLILY